MRVIRSLKPEFFESLSFTILLFMFISLVSWNVSGQTYPDTLWIPVTYYDFHSDGSNPEFEQNHTGGIYKNMVADTLDSERKPVPGNTPYLNHYIKYWYRDWNKAARGDYTIPDYDIVGSTFNASVTYKGIKSVNHDTAFKNIVIEDSLPFKHLGDGVYEYRDDATANFFPLNGRGFNEGKQGNNFSFTMELHTTFVMKPGITFNFAGDDDVWAFVDNKLAMDLGGIHGMERGSFKVDTLGLVPGREYNFDFFFAERHTSESHIRITTNIVSTKLAELTLHAQPDETVRAGDTVTAWAQTVDDTGGVHTGYSDLIKWHFLESGGHHDSTLISENSREITGDTVYFIPTEAHTQVKIEGILLDTNTNEYLRDTLTLTILPGAPHHLVLEGKAEMNKTALLDAQPIDQISIGPDETFGNAFAILRDKYGNFVCHSRETDWNTLSGNNLIRSLVSGNADKGEGIAYKRGAPGTARISAVDRQYQGDLFSDSIDVVINEANYSHLRVVVNNAGSVVPIEELTTNTDRCTLLTVLGYRGDLKRWEPVSGKWETDIPTSINPGQSHQSFKFCPIDTATSTVNVTYQSARYSLPVKVGCGGAARMDLFDFAGKPVNRFPLDNPPISYEVSAGDTFDIYAKLFDNNGYWLSEYESDDAPVAWSVIELSGKGNSGVLSAANGYKTGFVPHVARRSVFITATWYHGGEEMRDTVMIKTVHGPVHSINIQADTARLYTGDLDRMTFSARDTLKHAYAVFRDAFNNYISPAEFAKWKSMNSSIAQVKSGAFLMGEGLIYRRSDSTSAVSIIATSDDGNLSDTLTVDISRVTFSDIQIASYTSSFDNIDTLYIRTDQDTVLYARGRRTKDGAWIDIPADWDITGPISFRRSPPSSADKWEFIPQSVGSGRIMITGPDNVKDTIIVHTLPGLANSLVLYKNSEEPSPDGVFDGPGQKDTVSAGDPLLLAANVFDQRNSWLENYRTFPDDKKITWTLVEKSGEKLPKEALSNESGAQVTFTPTIAYKSVYVIATLTENDRVLRDSVYLFVGPGAIDHLVIEAGSNPRATSPTQDAPAQLISLTPRDTVKSAYAVLRDMFGNFVRFSNETNWISADKSLVSAIEAIKEYGQGNIYREADQGFTNVIASNRENPHLRDTVRIELSEITYDSVRVVTGIGQSVESIVLPGGGDTTVYAEGLRSDGRGWMQIPVDWHISSSLHVKNNPPAQKNSWRIEPLHEGTGRVWISLGADLVDTVNLTFLEGKAHRVVLYQKPGAPGITNPPLPDPSRPIVVGAGEPINLCAKLFDESSFWLRSYEKSDSADMINWKIVENGNSGYVSGTLDTDKGHSNIFHPRTASQTAHIVVSFKESYSDTVAVTIEPGAPHHIVLEGSQDPKVSPHRDNPIDTVTITELDTLKRVYAVIRDVYQNFIGHSKKTQWSSGNKDLILAENGNRNIGEGLIKRSGTEGISFIAARYAGDDSLQKPSDSLIVKVSAYHYTRLRIVNERGEPLENLVMTTNDDQSVFVQGYRSTGGWEPVSANWSISEDLVVTPAPPENAESWAFSPNKPASGWIRVGLDNDQTKPDTLEVVFDRGKPTSVEFDLLTPTDDITAGDTITTIVRIKNRNGLVPGTWCYPEDGNGRAVYADTLGNSDRNDLPSLITDDGSFQFNNKDLFIDQCFNDGVDTVKFVLYYAPNSRDSLHLLTVEIDGMHAQTVPFRLNPGNIDKLKLVRNNAEKEEIPDSLTLHFPDGAITIMSFGFDKYGNSIGPVNSDWYTTETLHGINYTENVYQIYYSSADVVNNEKGYVYAVKDNAGDSVYIQIKGPGAHIVNAVTRDTDGNGYLDAIEVSFDKKVLLPESFFGQRVADHFHVNTKSGTFEIPVSGISGVEKGDSVSTFTLLLDEQSSMNQPQTDWELTLTLIDAGEDINDIVDLRTTDGAAPVIWKVIRKVNNAQDRTTDKITVVFSEPVFAPDGTPLSLSTPPADLFEVWVDSTGSRVDDADVLDRIQSFAEGTHGDTAVFYMTNGEEVTGYHYFSLDAGGLSDGKYNTPAQDNRHTRAVVIGNLGSIRVGPNPLRPVYFQSTDRLLARNPREALGWARNRGGGVFVADFVVPGELGEKTRNIHDFNIRASLSIYDCIGNRVYSRRSGFDFLNEVPRTDWVTGTSQQLTVYWNGITDENRAAAPGIYRVIMMIEVDDEQVKIHGNLGIGR